MRAPSHAPKSLLKLAEQRLSACTEFLCDLVSIPSPSRGERLVCERVVRELDQLGFEDVHIDTMGNVLGRVGNGPRVLAFDAHVDTVGITKRRAWRFDPFSGAIENGILYGRGASDQKAGLATLIHGLHLLREVGVPEDVTLWVTGTVSGEECVGLAWQYLLKESGLAPEAVVIGMASHLGVCRGQRGRMEIEIDARGVSSHGAHPDRGSNAVLAMAPILEEIQRLHRSFENTHGFLGPASMTVTSIRSESPSLTAVPDRCIIHLDRRVTSGEDRETVLEQLWSLEAVQSADADIRLLRYEEPSWRGFQYATEKVFPAWETPAETPIVRAAQQTVRELVDREPRIHRSAFSSNGCVTAGMFGVPTIGFGPGDEIHSHTNLDQVPLAQLAPAMAFYAGFPAAYLDGSD